MADELKIRPEIKSPWTDFKIETYGPAQLGTADDMFTNSAYSWTRTYNTLDYELDYATGITDAYSVSEITSNDGNQKRS